MKRRQFLKKSSMMTAGAFSMPFLLPTGSLYAKTLNRRVNHVVCCLFAGGIRNLESVHMAEGNLMPAMLDGMDSTNPGLDPLPPSPRPVRLFKEGTLFPEFRYTEGPTGHFNGHTVALTGRYTNTGLNLQANPQFPTIFEYYLKHNSPTVTAKNAWWVSNTLGPYPALNYSRHPDYGPMYGANHLAPTSFLGAFNVVSNPKIFQFHEEEKVLGMRNFLNENFGKEAVSEGRGNFNTVSDAKDIADFFQKLVTRASNGQYNNPLGVPNQYANNDHLHHAVRRRSHS